MDCRKTVEWICSSSYDNSLMLKLYNLNYHLTYSWTSSFSNSFYVLLSCPHPGHRVSISAEQCWEPVNLFQSSLSTQDTCIYVTCANGAWSSAHLSFMRIKTLPASSFAFDSTTLFPCFSSFASSSFSVASSSSKDDTADSRPRTTVFVSRWRSFLIAGQVSSLAESRRASTGSARALVSCAWNNISKIRKGFSVLHHDINKWIQTGTNLIFGTNFR